MKWNYLLHFTETQSIVNMYKTNMHIGLYFTLTSNVLVLIYVNIRKSK